MKVCKKCKEEVPDDTDGACPLCGALDGYTVSTFVTLKWKIKDERDEIKRTIDKKFKEYDEFIKQGKNVEFYKKLKESLQAQTPEFLEQAEKNAKERLEIERKEKEKHQASFTVGATIGTREQADAYIEKLENKTNKLQADLNAQNFINEETNKTIQEMSANVKHIKDRLSPKATIIISLIVGISASLIASGLFDMLQNLQPISSEVSNMINETSYGD